MAEPERQTISKRQLRPAPQLVSVVVPLYNEAANVETLLSALVDVLEGLKYELVLVDDGSTDGTFDQIERLSDEYGGIVAVRLARNFGHQSALEAGMATASGQVVITMDGDMQHPPSLVPVLIQKWREGFNVVQTRRKDTKKVPFTKRLASRAFYRVFKSLCGVELQPGMADFRLVDKSVLDQVQKLDEGEMFLRGLIAWMGYEQAVVPFEVGDRSGGESKYTLRKMIHLAKTGLFSFSSLPLRISTRLGLLMALLAGAEFVYVIIVYFRGTVVPGWASTTAVLSALFAILFVLMGIQGEYIYRIYQRVRRRPTYLVAKIVRSLDE